MPYHENLTLEDIDGLLETYPGLIGIMDLEGKLLAAGSRYAELTGTGITQMIGHDNRDFAVYPVSLDTMIRKACDNGYFDSEFTTTDMHGQNIRLRLIGWPCIERNCVIFALSGAIQMVSRKQLAHSIQSLVSPHEDMHELLTKQEVAAMLKVNVRTVDRMCRRRELPSIRVGERYIRIPKRAISEYLRRRATDMS